MAENTQVDVKKLSFERALEELESIVKRLEDGKVPLEESVTIYERGESLKAAVRGVAAAGGGAGRQDHHRRQRPGDGYRAAGRPVTAGRPGMLEPGDQNDRFDGPAMKEAAN